VKQLTPEELQERLSGDGCPVLLDVREQWEYETARIEGSTHIPMQQIPQRYRELDAEAEIVVVCHHGARSAQVTQYLTQLGFGNVYNLMGGIDAWSRDIDPDVPTY
jgi:rhodanese-related sulfurtransferase